MSAEIPVITWTCKPGFEQQPDLIRKTRCEEWCEDHLKPLLDALDPHYKSWFGEDFGRSGDLTSIIPLQETPSLLYRAPFVVELSNVPFKQQEQILFYIVDRLPIKPIPQCVIKRDAVQTEIGLPGSYFPDQVIEGIVIAEMGADDADATAPNQKRNGGFQ